MKTNPIPFMPDMVRALLDGSKTQTRRTAKLTDAAHVKEPKGHRRWHPADPDAFLASPYGQAGDQLWVKEAYRIERSYDSIKPSLLPVASDGHTLAVPFWYDADLSTRTFDHLPEGLRPGKYRPGMFMPRAASRITLEITSVRVERLQDISEADALAEGVTPSSEPGAVFAPAKSAYCDLWESINKPSSWFLNPWVWVIEFKRIGVAA